MGVELRARRAWAVAAAGAGLVLIALVFDAGPLFVPGIALVALGLLAPLWVVWSARGARVRRVLSTERIVEDEPLGATLEVTRPPAASGWGRIEVTDPLVDGPLRLGGAGSPLGRSRAGRVRVVSRLARRGEHRLAPPELIARDPLELARARARSDGGEAQTVLVLPRTEPVRWGSASRGTPAPGGEAERAAEALAATDLDGLRPYRPGTPASRIHWPAVARGQGLIERRLQADGDRRPLVVLDSRERMTRQDGSLEHDRAPLDAAVRAAASLVLELARAGGCGLLLSGQARPMLVDPELATWPAVHARLAIVGTSADPEPPRAPSLQTAGGRSRSIIYVTAASHERLVASLAGAGVGRSVVLVVPDSELVGSRPRGVSGRAAPVLAVSGCRGFALGAPRAHGPVAISGAGVR